LKHPDVTRSEKYIPPSDEELERWRQASEAAKRFDVEREELLRAALKKMKKANHPTQRRSRFVSSNEPVFWPFRGS
jgi:hypothetical protein